MHRHSNTGINQFGFSSDLYSELFFIIRSNPCTSCEIIGNENPADLVVSDLTGRIIVVGFTKLNNGYAINFLINTKGFFFIRSKNTGQVLKFLGNRKTILQYELCCFMHNPNHCLNKKNHSQN
ncbi:MAG: hypothetical protein D4R43_02885 [Sphingobacteriales bacterium]|nr:MAG: hypothetical protein D4R43_02885 [Sphingobacteriales bacterium]